MKTLKPFFWFTDIAFIVYWLITALHLIPPEFLFQDYTNPILRAWNWSFPSGACERARRRVVVRGNESRGAGGPAQARGVK